MGQATGAWETPDISDGLETIVLEYGDEVFDRASGMPYSPDCIELRHAQWILVNVPSLEKQQLRLSQTIRTFFRTELSNYIMTGAWDLIEVEAAVAEAKLADLRGSNTSSD